MVNDSLVVHGGQLSTGRYLSDIWFLDLKPALAAFQADGVTCRTIQFMLRRGSPCVWQAPRLSTASAPIAGHALGVWGGDPHMLLVCGGTSEHASDSEAASLPVCLSSTRTSAPSQVLAQHES